MENAQNMEIFKDIKGYPGYQISNFGRIWSSKSNKYLSPVPNNVGYLQIKLIAANGKRKSELVHRLVALGFIENPSGYPEVDHIDKNIRNNSSENLRWVSRSGNCRNTCMNRAVAQYDMKGKFIREFASLTEAAESVGGTYSGIKTYFDKNHSSYKGYMWKIL